MHLQTPQNKRKVIYLKKLKISNRFSRNKIFENLFFFFIFRFSSYAFGLLYFYYTNQTNDTIAEESLQMTKLINLKAAHPINGEIAIYFKINIINLFRWAFSGDNISSRTRSCHYL